MAIINLRRSIFMDICVYSALVLLRFMLFDIWFHSHFINGFLKKKLQFLLSRAHNQRPTTISNNECRAYCIEPNCFRSCLQFSHCFFSTLIHLFQWSQFEMAALTNGIIRHTDFIGKFNFWLVFICLNYVRFIWCLYSMYSIHWTFRACWIRFKSHER